MDQPAASSSVTDHAHVEPRPALGRAWGWPGSGLDEMATVPEVAAYLRISRTSAYELARQGRIPVVRLGRSLRVPRAALLRLIDAGHGPAP